MIKALLRYDKLDRNRVVKVLTANNIIIKQMYDGLDSFKPKIVCMFENETQMNSILYAMNNNSYYGVELLRYREEFDFKKWWKGEK